MDDMNMNQVPPQQPAAPMGAPVKKGYGTVTTLIVLVVLILAAFLLWPKKVQTVTPTSNTATPAQQQQTQTQAQADDLNSIQTDLDATNVDGVSNSL